MPHMELWAIVGSSALAGAAFAHLMARRQHMRHHMMMAMAATNGAGASGSEAGGPQDKSELAEKLRAWKSHHMGHWGGHGCGGRRGRHWRGHRGFAPTGNRAFDEYRAEALDRLEAEAKEFREFLDRLRQAKDKGEFDAFMAERKTAQEREVKDEGPKGEEPKPE